MSNTDNTNHSWQEPLTLNQLTDLLRTRFPGEFMVDITRHPDGSTEAELKLADVKRATWKSRLANKVPADGITPRDPSEYYDLKFFDVPKPLPAESGPINTNKRLFDLVRFSRAELHEADLITEEEYAWLCGHTFADDPKTGSPSSRRLEDYDELRTLLTATQKLLERAKPLIADEWQGTSDTSTGMVWLADYNANFAATGRTTT